MTKTNSALANAAKLLIAAAAIVHLIFTNIHTKALLLLENEICGFYMFIYVLMGLVLLFECTQIKPGHDLEKILIAVLTAIMSVPALLLIHIYLSACRTQRQLDTAVVMRAVTMSAALLAVFAAAAVMLLVDMALEKRGKRHEKAA